MSNKEEQVIKELDRIFAQFHADLDAVRKKQGDILANFIRQLENKKIEKIRKDLA